MVKTVLAGALVGKTFRLETSMTDCELYGEAFASRDGVKIILGCNLSGQSAHIFAQVNDRVRILSLA